MKTNNKILNTTYWIIKIFWLLFIVLVIIMGIFTISVIIFPGLARQILTSGKLSLPVMSSRVIITQIHPGNFQIMIISLIFTTLGSGLGLSILWFLKKIFKRVLAKNIFVAENVASIRIIGFLTIFGNILLHVLLSFTGMLIQSQPGMEVTINFMPDLNPIFLGLLILALAEVFKYGIDLQTDHDLTV